MRTMRCHELGANATLQLDDAADARARPGRVLVEVHGCAVSFPDVLMMRGEYQHQPPLPFAPGAELSGIVGAVGDGVDGFAIGDRVIANTGYGGLSELVAVPASLLVRVPDGVDIIEASAFLSAYATSHWALHARGNLSAGETVLVLGAAGGVGLAAVELAAMHGARVIAAASTDEKLDLCRRCGATDVINYSREDLKERAKELTNGRGVDIVYDAVGGPYSEAAFRAIAWNGRFLVVGFAAGGGVPKLALNLPLLKGASIVGALLGGAVRNDPDRYRAMLEELTAMWANGQLKPHVSKTYPLAEAAQAIQDVAERRAVGRIVVAVRH
jgi:NADPH:quinone reductase